MMMADATANANGMPTPLPIAQGQNTQPVGMPASMAAVAAANPAVAAAMKLHEDKEHQRQLQQLHAQNVQNAQNAAVAAATAAALNVGGASGSGHGSMAGGSGNGTPNANSGRKSLAYVHTVLLKHMTDSSGKQHEMRQCLYCDAAFSFKGGTTSAALRHVKTSHPEQLYGDAAARKNAILMARNNSFSSMLMKKDMGPGRVRQGTPQSPVMMNPTSASASGVTSHLHHNSALMGGGASGPHALEDTVDQFDDTEDAMATSPSHGCKRPRIDTEDVDEDDVGAEGNAAELGGDEDADRDEPLDDQQMASLLLTADAMRALAASHHTMMQWRKKMRVLTPSQEAISHFIQHHKDLLQVHDRLRFVKHLTSNVTDAEMYNVLDTETRVAFIKEFCTTGHAGSVLGSGGVTGSSSPSSSSAAAARAAVAAGLHGTNTGLI
ncbi:TPA: hypothetical protein N0F65_010486 [Lagenidium giganteum]|uniref:BED-type domain-containing protein n=1 Tax=Lagenidium giganteum TaxID=4803 RepID=A0AAV2Z8L0_9STRA|nr:TPA: hypothetical protein N0F65_010486 [Lagenidium giganteum]